jgi:hypothetical protein
MDSKPEHEAEKQEGEMTVLMTFKCSLQEY